MAALVLGSASPRRLDLLRQMGIEPTAVVSTDIDETPLAGELPPALASRLAHGKAVAASALYPDHYVLTADTVVSVGRRILPKAEDDATVAQCLHLLSGRRHRIQTGLAIVPPDGTPRLRLVTSIALMKRLTPREIESYAACGEGLGKAGGYGMQGRAAAFIPFISGSYSNIIGLPMHDVYQMLTGLGFYTER